MSCRKRSGIISAKPVGQFSDLLCILFLHL
jgi:hypothetical protein